MAEDTHVPPWLRGRSPPRGLDGWLQRRTLASVTTPETARPMEPEIPLEVLHGPPRKVDLKQLSSEDWLAVRKLVTMAVQAGIPDAQIARDLDMREAEVQAFSRFVDSGRGAQEAVT